MANVLIGAPNFSDLSSSAQPNLFTPALSGGSWEAGNPLANLQSRKLHLVARSSGALEAQTQLTVDLGGARPVRVVAIPKHTITTAGTYRVTAISSSALLGFLAGMNPNALGGTFSRTGTATYTDRDGIIRTAATGVPRDAHFVNGERTLLLETASTNQVTFGRDLSTGAWTLSSMTAAATATGIDGASNAATRLTATGANATALRTITGSIQDRVFSVYARRVTGTGTVEIRQNSTGAWTAITLTSAWQRFSITEVIGSSSVGFRIVTSGDAIEVDGVQYENDRTVPSSVIFTSGATATRNADSLTWPSVSAGTRYDRYYAVGSGSPTTVVAAHGAGAPTITLNRAYTHLFIGAGTLTAPDFDAFYLDSGARNAWPAGWTAETAAGLNVALVYTTSADFNARYLSVQVNNRTNPAGFIDLARLVVSGGYQPTFNFSVGATVTTESETTRTVTDGGAAIYDTRPLRRIARFAVDNLEANEAWLSAWRVMKRLGASNQCFLVLDPDASADVMAETAFLCVPRELSVLEYSAAMFRSLGFAFTEEL